MRKVFIMVIICFLFQNSFGQDKIQTKDKQELNVKIVEQTDKLVRYKMIDFENSPIIAIKINRIEKIEYQNGFVDLVGNQNPRHNRPFGINAGIFLFLTHEGGMFSFSLDYFVIPQISFEVNIGTELEDGSYFTVGGKFHLNSDYSDNRFTPFTGILVGSALGDGIVQIPIGVNFLARNGFNIALSINELFYFNSGVETFVELKIGWKFKL